MCRNAVCGLHAGRLATRSQHITRMATWPVRAPALGPESRQRSFVVPVIRPPRRNLGVPLGAATARGVPKDVPLSGGSPAWWRRGRLAGRANPRGWSATLLGLRSDALQHHQQAGIAFSRCELRGPRLIGESLAQLKGIAFQPIDSPRNQIAASRDTLAKHGWFPYSDGAAADSLSNEVTASALIQSPIFPALGIELSWNSRRGSPFNWHWI